MVAVGSGGDGMIPQTTNEVGLALAQLGRDLDKTKDELNDADMAATRAQEERKVAEARALVAAEGRTGEERKAQATIATHEVRLDAEVKDAIVRGLTRQMRTLQSRIDVGRTLGAGIRKETELGGYGRSA